MKFPDSLILIDEIGRAPRGARGLKYRLAQIRGALGTSRPARIEIRMASATVVRSLLVGDDFVLVGFKEAEWAEQLKTQ